MCGEVVHNEDNFLDMLILAVEIGEKAAELNGISAFRHFRHVDPSLGLHSGENIR